MVKCLATAGPQIAKKLASQAVGINRSLTVNAMLADPSRQRASEAALSYTRAGGPQSKLSRQTVADDHNVTISALRAAERRLKQPTGMLPTTREETAGPDHLVGDDSLYIVGKHVIERASNDACLIWAEIAGLLLICANLDLESKGKQPMTSFTKSTWTRTKNRLIDFWAKLNIKLGEKRKGGVVEAKRKHAVRDLEPFFKVLSKVFSANPLFLKEPQRIMNLDETPLSRQSSEFSDAGVVADMSITHNPKQTSKGKAPPSATAVTVSYADGEKGPISILTKGENPTVDHWWKKPLPPGLDVGWRRET